VPINFLVKAGITAGLMVAQVALGAMRKIEGPRLDNRKLTTAEYGTPLVRGFWGICRFSGCPMPWAEDLLEKKKKTKTKGGKYTEYKYYWTGQIHIADCEIDAVRKIWFDNHLVYQVAGVGPIAALIMTAVDPAAEGAEIKIMRNQAAIYLGTEDQLPDGRMEAWFEDQPDLGPGSCPAFRGTAHIVFKDIPVEKFGNRPPTVDIEAVRIKSAIYPYEIKTTGQSTSGEFSFGGGWMAYWDASGQIEWWDSASRTLIGNSPAPGVFTSSARLALNDSGTAFGVGNQYLIITTPMGGPLLTPLVDPASLLFSNVRVFGNVAYIAYADTAGYMVDLYHVAHSQRARDFCIDEYGDVWVLFQPDGSSDDFTIENLGGAQSYTFNGLVTRTDVSAARFCYTKWGNFFIDGGDGKFYIVARSDGSLVSSGAAGWAQPAVLPAQNPSQSSFWDNMSEYSLEDGSLIRALNLFDWVFANTAKWGFDPVLNANVARQSASNNMIFRYLDRIGSNGIDLGTIVDEVSSWVGLSPDVADLDQLVQGWSVIPGTAREMIEPLLDIHNSICRPHDFGLQYIKRNSTSLGTIAVETLVREGDQDRYTIDEDTALPRSIVVTYADKGKDHQANTVTTQRDATAVDVVKPQQINLETYVGTPDEMQGLADRYLRGKWNRRHTVKNTLTPKYLAAEPGDIYDLDLDGILWTAEIEKLTFAAGALQVEWRRTFPSLSALGSAGGPDMLGKDEDEIFVPGPTKGMLLDIPFTSDAENSANPLLHYAAGGFGISPWPGAAVLEGDLSGDEYGEWNAVPSNDNAVWGFATTALGDANACLWDRGNTLTVQVFNGTLSNVTEADINADPSVNMFALKSGDDWELGNFTTATLNATTDTYKEYEISGFLRGRRGTEWATNGHASGDEFVLISSVFADDMGLSEVGATQYFKAQTYGRDPEMAQVISFEFDGQSLMPYAPVIDSVSKDASGDIEIVIRTRTRVGGAWNGSTIPTGETIAEYEFDVYDGTDFLRTLTSTDKTFTYTAADQTSDFGSEIAAADLEGFAYQLSATVGRGFARAA
jgi:hypothetical protein